MRNISTQTIRLDSLTSLRFLAIMIVVVHHLRTLIGWGPKTGWGAVGVTFFFVLSGFVLTLNYQNIVTCTDAVSFLWRRFARLYPLYLVTFIVSFFVIHFYNINLDTGIVSSLANLLLLQSWFSSSQIHFAYNSASWAVSTLIFFYVIFVFIQSNFLRNFMVIFSLSLISLFISIKYIHSNNSSPIDIHWLLHMFPTNRILVFLIGIILGKIYLQFRDRFSNASSFVASSSELLLLLLIVDRLSTGILLNAIFRAVNSMLLLPPLLARQIVDIYILTPTLCGLLILVCSLQRGAISRLLSYRTMVYLGEISFAIYLSHQVIFRILSKMGFITVIPLTFLAFAITFCISHLLYRFVEKPCSQYLNRYPYIVSRLLDHKEPSGAGRKP